MALEIQHSVIQCQTDSTDVKSTIIQAQSIINTQELPSPIHSNISPVSPRPVVVASSTIKPVLSQAKLLSPNEKHDPSTSPRQGVKRSFDASSPVRNINRSEL